MGGEGNVDAEGEIGSKFDPPVPALGTCLRSARKANPTGLWTNHNLLSILSPLRRWHR